MTAPGGTSVPSARTALRMTAPLPTLHPSPRMLSSMSAPSTEQPSMTSVWRSLDPLTLDPLRTTASDIRESDTDAPCPTYAVPTISVRRRSPGNPSPNSLAATVRFARRRS